MNKKKQKEQIKEDAYAKPERKWQVACAVAPTREVGVPVLFGARITSLV
jgi:hypothetical protein